VNLRVLIVHPTFHIYGGAELAIVELIKFLHGRGINVDLLTNNINFKVRRELTGLCNLQVAMGYDSFHEIAKYVQSYYRNYDVINMHNHPAELSLYPYKSNTTWYVHEPESALHGKIDNNEVIAVNKSINKIATNSEYNQTWIKELYNMDSTVIRYGVDHKLFSKSNPNNPNITKYNIPKDNYIVLQSGWFNPFKRQEMSVEAFTRFHKEVPNSNLVLVGENNNQYANKIFNMIRSSSARNNIIVTGMVDRATARDWYSKADLLINPASKQGSFLATYEVMSMGKPIIVSNEVPDIQLIKDKELCIHTDDFYTSIKDYYNGKLSYNLDKTQKWVRDNLTWDNYGSKMLSLYKV